MKSKGANAYFCVRDTTVSEPANAQDWNPYAYVDNGPLSFTDPTGHDPDAQNLTDPGQKTSPTAQLGGIVAIPAGISPASYPNASCEGACYNLIPIVTNTDGSKAVSYNPSAQTGGENIGGAAKPSDSGGQSSAPGANGANGFNQGSAVVAGATGAGTLVYIVAGAVCGLAEPCGAVATGLGAAAVVGGLLAGTSAVLSGGITTDRGLAASAFTGGVISGATGGVSEAIGVAGTAAVGIGATGAGLGAVGGDLAGQLASGQKLNINSAAASGATAISGYFLGGSFAVDTVGVGSSSAAGLITNANGTIISTGGNLVINHRP